MLNLFQRHSGKVKAVFLILSPDDEINLARAKKRMLLLSV